MSIKNQLSAPVLKGVFFIKKIGRIYASCRRIPYGTWKSTIANKVNKRQIGSIKSSTGLGECIFNERFLSEHPEFRKWHVFRNRTGRNQLI